MHNQGAATAGTSSSSVRVMAGAGRWRRPPAPRRQPLHLVQTHKVRCAGRRLRQHPARQRHAPYRLHQGSGPVAGRAHGAAAVAGQQPASTKPRPVASSIGATACRRACTKRPGADPSRPATSTPAPTAINGASTDFPVGAAIEVRRHTAPALQRDVARSNSATASHSSHRPRAWHAGGWCRPTGPAPRQWWRFAAPAPAGTERFHPTLLAAQQALVQQRGQAGERDRVAAPATAATGGGSQVGTAGAEAKHGQGQSWRFRSVQCQTAAVAAGRSGQQRQVLQGLAHGVVKTQCAALRRSGAQSAVVQLVGAPEVAFISARGRQRGDEQARHARSGQGHGADAQAPPAAASLCSQARLASASTTAGGNRVAGKVQPRKRIEPAALLGHLHKG